MILYICKFIYVNINLIYYLNIFYKLIFKISQNYENIFFLCNKINYINSCAQAYLNFF